MLYLLTHALERSAARDPDHPAVRARGVQLTYGELADQSDRLARVLVDAGVRRGDRVGLYMPKGVEAAVAIYGIMKAGAAYVPLDPQAPPARLAFVVQDCGIRHLVAWSRRRPALQQLVGGGDLRFVIEIEGREDLAIPSVPWSTLQQLPAGPAPAPGTMEQDLAYVLYTSGSTGEPKGIMHTHRSALAWAEVAARTYGFHAGDRLCNHAPLHFDISTLDYFSTAVVGATTLVIPEEHTKLPASLAQLMETERATVFYGVPLALIQLHLSGALASRDLTALRWVLFGGEPMPTKYLRALMAQWPHARFSNVYGPTETNGVTYHIVPPLDPQCDDPIPIGRPYDNVDPLVMGSSGVVCQPGEPGELLIRSATVMQGYWGRPDLNATAFLERPAPGGRLDRFQCTGDLVIEQPDGSFRFLGRRDRQIKARGHRVELDEVEAVLLNHPHVEEAAVFAVPDSDGSRQIESAVIARSGCVVTASALSAHAAERLPRYAVPVRIRILETFPRTSTGKIDRRQLEAAATAERAPSE